MDPHTGLNRRDVLKAGVLLGVAAAAGCRAGGGAESPEAASAAAAQGATRRRSVRLAHVTDMHIQPELGGFEGVGACLRHVQSVADRPEFIVMGGDMIMDSVDEGHARTAALWDLWNNVIRTECSLPVKYCLGNHDIWGWNKSKSGTTGHEPGWGKKWAMEVLGLERPYHSFDRAGWRFVVLDSIYPDGEGYRARLDDEQYAWLEGVLAETPRGTHVVVVSHIPILGVTSLAGQKGDPPETIEVHPALMHTDCARLVSLFERHPNVRACLSGHMHEVERIEYQGVTYLCDGAVCGAWWKGRQKACDEGYALIDLFDDGGVERAYETYGWKSRA